MSRGNIKTQSGRTVGKMISRESQRSRASEKRGLRVKNQLQPTGKERFPKGKFKSQEQNQREIDARDANKSGKIIFSSY